MLQHKVHVDIYWETIMSLQQKNIILNMLKVCTPPTLSPHAVTFS